MHRQNVNLILAAVALLLGVVSLDQYLVRRYPHNSGTLTVMELRTGGNVAAQEKMSIRRDHVEQVVALLADPADPLQMSPQERTAMVQQVQVIESLLCQAMWAADELWTSLSEEERRRIDEARGDRLLMNQALRSGPRYYEERLAEAFRIPTPTPVLPPKGWTPDTDPALAHRWEELRRGGEGFVGDSMLDLDAGVLILAIAQDQSDHPVRGELAERRYALAGALVQSTVSVDTYWKHLYSLLMQGGSGRGEILPAPPNDMQPLGGDDLEMPDLIRALREHLVQMEKGA